MADAIWTTLVTPNATFLQNRLALCMEWSEEWIAGSYLDMTNLKQNH